jgi:hypothetical protein
MAANEGFHTLVKALSRGNAVRSGAASVPHPSRDAAQKRTGELETLQNATAAKERLGEVDKYLQQHAR